MFEPIFAMVSAAIPMVVLAQTVLVLGFALGLTVGMIVWPEATEKFVLEKLDI